MGSRPCCAPCSGQHLGEAVRRLPQEPPEAAATYARALLTEGGPQRLLWGSDWPFAAFESTVTYRSTLDALRTWVPDPAMRRIIGAETPLALYFT